VNTYLAGYICMTVSDKITTPPNPPIPETQISRYLAVQIQIESLFQFEFVPRNVSFWGMWVSGFGGLWGGFGGLRGFSVETVIQVA